MAEVLFRAKLQRDDSQNRWGFCLQGGADCKKPLTLLQVVPDSVASKGGLMPGDIVVKLAGQTAIGMTHVEAQQTIINAGNTLEIIVERSEEITSPPAINDLPPFPSDDKSKTVSSAHDKENKKPQTKELGRSTTKDDNTDPVKDSKEPFPVTSILKTNSQENKPSNNVKVKLAGKGKSVKFLDQSPPRKYRQPSPSPIRYRGRKRQSPSPRKNRSSSAPVISYSRVRITDRSGKETKPSSTSDRKLNVIPGDSVKTEKEKEGAITDSDGELSEAASDGVSDSEKEDNPKDGDPRYPWRRSRADITRRADLFKEEMERKARERLKERQAEQKTLNVDVNTSSHVTNFTVPQTEQIPQTPPRGIPIAVQHQHSATTVSHRGHPFETMPTRGHTNETAPERGPTIETMPDRGHKINPPPQRGRGSETIIIPNPHSHSQHSTIGHPARLPMMIHPQISHQYYVVHPPGPSQRVEEVSVQEQDIPSPVGVNSINPSSQPPVHSNQVPVHTVTMDPEVAALPVPTVKEIVYDLNRRLEVLASRQPELAKALTPQELGVSFLRKEITSPPSRDSTNDGEQPANTLPNNVKLEQKLPDQPFIMQIGQKQDQEPSFQKIYDVSSPLSSPKLQRKKFNIEFTNVTETSPLAQKKVTFAEPLEQFRVIEPRKKELEQTYKSVTSMDIGPEFEPGVEYSYNVPTRQFEISVSQPGGEETPSTIKVSLPAQQPMRQAYHFNISPSGIEVLPKSYSTVNPAVSLQYSYPPSYADAIYASSQGVKAAENIPHPGHLGPHVPVLQPGQQIQNQAVPAGQQIHTGLLSANQQPQSPVMTPSQQSTFLSPGNKAYLQSLRQAAQAAHAQHMASSEPQSRSFRNLQSHLSDGGNVVPHELPPQSRVPQPAAAAKPFYPQEYEPPSQMYEPRGQPYHGPGHSNVTFHPAPQGTQGSRTIASLSPAAAISLQDKMPGLIAIFDRGDGVQPQSETYRLVHEMDSQKTPRKHVSDL